VICVEQIIGDDLMVIVCGVGKTTSSVAVTKCPDSGYIRLELIIDKDVAVIVHRNPCTFKAQVVGVWCASHRKKNMCAWYIKRAIVTFRGDDDAIVSLR
jgi:hypothetical protein